MTIPTLTSTVRPVRTDEADRLAEALAAAFFADPVFAWFFPRPRQRFARITRFFRRTALATATLPHGHVYTDESVAGGALWMPPGEGDMGVGDQLRMLPELVRVLRLDTVRGLRPMAEMDTHHPHEDHWYLWFAGVAPAQQGRGLGSALLQPVLDRCDADGMPAYLEATSPRNRRLYERHGFEVTTEFTLPGGGPPLWSMWREAR